MLASPQTLADVIARVAIESLPDRYGDHIKAVTASRLEREAWSIDKGAADESYRQAGRAARRKRERSKRVA